MTKKKLMMMVAALSAAFGAWAETETIGDYTWTYWNYGSGAEVAGVEPAMGTVTIPSTLGGSPVTKVGNSAFSGRSSLTGVSIPSSVTSIEARAFYGCSGLRNVAMPVSVKTLGDGVFQNCTGLESVSIPVSITAIPYNAFYGCSSLRTLDLPVTVKLIGSYAFYGCVSLSSVSIPFSVKSIGDYSFYGCSSLSNLELSGGLESIGYNAFYGCNGLREVVIPASVTSVSSYAFGACGNIRRVTVPECVLHNMASVFGDSCSTITSLAITEGVKSIDSSSFYNCDGLTSISIPASVTRIGESVFRYSCPALSEITIAPGNANYKFSGGLLLTKDGKEIVAVPRGRTWVSIPDTVTKIGRETFNNCPNLNFTWRNGVKSIDGWVLGCDEDDLPKNFTLSGYRGIANGAFSYCEALTGITIGEGVKSIGAYSFEECSNLTSISIPASVTHIDDSAFDGCYRISSISLASGNRNYKYSGGLLVSADDTELVAVSRTVTSVKIPEGVSCVRSGFFAGCAKLTGVTFPSSVEEVGDYGSMFGGWEEIEDDDDWYHKFHGCPALKTITVAPGNQYYKSVNGLLLGMDDGDLTLKAVPQSLTSVNVPEGVRWLSGDAFVGCSKLTAVTFPRSLYEYDGELYDDEYDIDESSGPYKLTSINVAAGNEEYSSSNGLLLSADGTEIYEVPRGLTSVTIPASVTYVDPEDFEYCTKLKSFSVEKGSKSFFAANGMLLTKNGKELLCVPTALKSQMTITIPADTMRIGGDAFCGFSQLTSIVIPEGVAEIGDYAFSYCTALSSVKLPQSLTKIGGCAFRDCSLTSLVLPNGLESIGARAFEGCKLSSIAIPNSVTHVHADAFGSRGKSSSGTCEPSDVNNKNAVFDADSIPGLLLVDGWVVGLDSSSRIQNEQDDPTEYLNQALQDARIRGIACRAFEDCSWLRCLTLPSCVKYVGGSLFDGCSRLEWVVIPEGVEEIEGAAFSGCQNLSGVSIPDSVRTVRQSVFQGCSFIDKESIPGIEIVDGWILHDVGVSSQLAENDSFDGTYVISGEQGIRGIADGAFAGYGHGEYAGCANTDPGLMGVTSLVVGDGVTAIGSRAFAFCDDLTNVYVAASVKYIGEEAFYDCRGLTSVQLPDTLKGKIPDSVFAKCPESLKITYYEAPRSVHVATFRDNYSQCDEPDAPPGSDSHSTTHASISRHTNSDGTEDWYWKTTVVVSRGQAHTFWITGLTKNAAITNLDVYCEYTYKEDGETYEDFIVVGESRRIKNSDGGWDVYAFLSAEDWENVPSSMRALKFDVVVSGVGCAECSNSDMEFIFGHSEGIMFTAPKGSLDNPAVVIPCESLTVNSAFDGEYFIKLNLTAGKKYFFGIEGGPDLTMDFSDAYGEAPTNLNACTDWHNCQIAFTFVPYVSGMYVAKIAGEGPDGFSFYSAVSPIKKPKEHVFEDLPVGTESVRFMPGHINAPDSEAYDDVIDESLFRIVDYSKGDNLLFRAEGLETPLLMRLYDENGHIIAQSECMGEGEWVLVAWTATANYSPQNAVYLGVCQPCADDIVPHVPEITVTADIVEFPNVITPVPVVSDSKSRSPDAADFVEFTAERTLSPAEWVNTFVIAARAGATYRVKAVASEAQKLKIFSRLYTISGTAKSTLSVEAHLSGSLDPSCDGWLEFTSVEDCNVYIDVFVADGEYGSGKGRNFGPYSLCATVAGCPYDNAGVLSVSMNGASESGMGWRILAGPNIVPEQETFHSSGSNVVLPPGNYTLVAKEVAGFAHPLAAGFTTCKVVAGELTTMTYAYNDQWDPLDDNPDTSVKDPVTSKYYSPFLLAPSETAPAVVSRTLWSGDAADWFVIRAKGGNSYKFTFSETMGAPKMTVFGPNNWNNECMRVVVDEQTGDSQITNAISGVYYVRISHADEVLPIDSVYELQIETHSSIPLSNSRIVERREVEEGRTIGELPAIQRNQCKFLGWFTESEGGEQISDKTLMGESDVAYYAHWWCYGDVFEGVGLSALDEHDNIIVTLTNDVSGTVEIPDYVGAVTIDLNGHDIVGDDGPAIRIVKGDGDGGATQLAIVDTSEGGKGQISGGGESAGIEVAEDAATGVKLDVEEGVGVFNGDGSEQELKPMLVGTGKVTVPKSWKTGQKVTWKATADKGSVFARWEGPLVDSLNLTKNERRNPSLAFAVPEGFETNMVTAVFIPIDDDGLYALGITQTEFELKEAVSGVRVTDDSQSYVTATASGLPTGLKFDAKKMTIAGTPTKSGVYWVQIKAKNASGYQWAENVMVTVSGDGKEAKEPKLTRTAYYPLTVICANDGGTVSGTGVYAEGKNVSVKATPAKGYVFAGWHETANSEKGTVNGVDGADYRSASLNVTVPEMRYVFAKFATKEDDADSLKVEVEDVTTEKDGTIALNLGACVESLSLPKLAVSGLPTGLKYDAKTLKVVGKATKPGVYTVTVKATNAAVTKATGASTATFKITVPNFECAALPGLRPETDAYGIVRSGVIFDDGLVDCSPANGWTVKVAGLPSGLKWDAKLGKIVGVPTAKAGSYTVTFTASKKGEPNQVATITLNVEALPTWAVGTFDGHVIAGGELGDHALPCGLVNMTVAANGKISGKVIDADGTLALSAAAFDSVEGPVSNVAELVFHATVIGKSGKMAITNEVEIAAEEVAARPESAPYLRGVVAARSVIAPYQNLEPGVEWCAWQNLWKSEPWKTEAKAFAKAPVLTMDAGTRDACPYPGTITLKFAATGAVTASGKFVTGQDAKGKDIVYSASCSSVLIPDGDGVRISPEQSEHCEAMSLEACAPALPDALDFRVFLYFAPKAGKFDGFADEIPLIWDGAGFSPE